MNSIGCYITSGTNATFTGNTFLNNYRYGLLLYHSNGYAVYRNNFIDNSAQIFNQSGSVLNQESPIGGNYWSDFDTPEEGCYDTDNDGFCDAPYCDAPYCMGDYLPWVKYNGWYISDVQATITDNNSCPGAKEIHYILDGTETIISGSTASVLISTDGVHNLSYWGVDYAGNKETAHTTNIKIDQTPPTTNSVISGTSGNNGWYISDVTIDLAATDTVSGVKEIKYSINGQTTTVSGDRTSITLTADGKYDITYYAIDNAGNIEAQNSISINIDRTVPPITTVTATPNILWPPNHKMVNVKIDGSATDDMSGIASVVITVTDEYGIYNMTVPGFGSTIQLEAWREGTDKDGRVYTITVTVTDNAGNKSTATAGVTVPHDMGK